MPVPSRAGAILAGNLIPFAVGTLFMIGRVYSRAIILRQFGTDDWILLAGWAVALANCVLACLGTLYGSGNHEVDIPSAWQPTALKLNYATLLCYQLALGLTKLAIAFFYLRIFNVMRRDRLESWAIIIFILCFTVPLEIVGICSCIPPQRVWDPSTPGHCINTIPAFWTSFITNLIADIWLIAFAVPRVWRLQILRRQKVALLITISLGWLVAIASIVRVARIWENIHSKDITWRSYDSSIWSAVEINVSVICASAPALKPLFKRFFPGLMNSLSGKTRGSRGLKPYGTSAAGKSGGSKWTRNGKKDAGVVELTDVARSGRHGRFGSQEGFAYDGAGGQNTWTAGRLEQGRSGGDSDDDSDQSLRYPEAPSRIHKVTRVEINSARVPSNM